MGILTCELPLIVIAAHERCIVNKQIWVGEFKYGLTATPHLQVVKGHVTHVSNYGTLPYLRNGWSQKLQI